MDDIFSWCKDGDSIQVRIWLDDPLNDVNQGDDHGFSPLHWTCLAGRANIAEMLLTRGARINAANMGADTGLHLAASFGNADCVELLLKNKADVNAVNEHGNTPLHYACFWGHATIAELLIVNGGARADIANSDGDTPLDKCHRTLATRVRELALGSGQDLAKRVSYRDASLSGVGHGKSRDAALSRFAQISLAELNFNERIAVTHSGETWRAVWPAAGELNVVVKFVNFGAGECSPRTMRAFLDEAAKLRIFSHPNVLPMLCAAAEPPRLALVSQLMPLGSLFNILHNNNQQQIDQRTATKFALDIARGMAFLHSLDKLVPRLYLNTFHVLIDSDQLTARINMADAKFSFQERNRVYQPAWIAPEALQKKDSDINLRAANMWSFGIVLWELATRQVPFAGLSAIEVGMKVALEDLRVVVPLSAPKHLARLTRICMNEEPGKRPTFDQIIPILTKMAHA